MRHHQEGVRAGLLGDPGEPQRLCPAVADARDHRQPPVGDLGRGRDDRAVLVLVQGEELTGSAGGEDRARRGRELGGQIGAVRVQVEAAVVPEAREREGQHAARHAVPQSPCHVLGLRAEPLHDAHPHMQMVFMYADEG